MDESGNKCVFSPCRTWRYVLRHSWGAKSDGNDDDPGRAIAWIALNPSTADENKLDPTLRRIRGFSAAWGFDTFYMLNLFAFRATDPREMRRAADPVGPENDMWILEFANRAECVVCAWGRHGLFNARQDDVLAMLRGHDLRYLAKTHDGIPKHPLYLKSSLLPAKMD